LTILDTRGAPYLDTVFEPLMQNAVAEIGATSTLLEQIAGYHLGWRHADLTPVTGARPNPGKRIRPKLAILVTMGLGAEPEFAAPVAAAIELLHNFTLVTTTSRPIHLRRHRATVWSLWGVARRSMWRALSPPAISRFTRRQTGRNLRRTTPGGAGFDRTTLAIVGGQTSIRKRG